MTKTNKKLINFGLVIIAILAFGTVVLMPLNVGAQNYSYVPVQPYTPSTNSGFSADNTYSPPSNNPTPVIYSLSPNSKNQTTGTATISIVGNNFSRSSVARWNGSPRFTIFVNSSNIVLESNPNDLLNAGTFQISVMNATGLPSNSVPFFVNQVNQASIAPVQNGNNTYPAVNTTGVNTNVEEANNSLASTVLLGSGGGFLPSGIIQWLFVAIFVLLAVILLRKIYLTHNPDQKPLKHA